MQTATFTVAEKNSLDVLIPVALRIQMRIGFPGINQPLPSSYNISKENLNCTKNYIRTYVVVFQTSSESSPTGTEPPSEGW